MRIGIDVGGTHTRGIALAGDGRVTAHAERRTGFGDTEVLGSVLDIVSRLAETTATEPSQIGIGIPGLVDSDTGVVQQVANLGIARLPLGEQVAASTGAVVVVDNDVNAATLGALRHVRRDLGVAPKSFAYVNIGTGLGVGLVVNGQVVHGRSGYAGELGHFALGLTDRECGCGQRGCIETSTSGSALTRFSPDWKRGTPLPDDFMHGLVALLQITTLATDPTSIVLGGGVVDGNEGFLDQALQALAEFDIPGSFISHLAIPARISIATTSDLGSLGAALLPDYRADTMLAAAG